MMESMIKALEEAYGEINYLEENVIFTEKFSDLVYNQII